jgi:hypothetical protein
MPISPNPVAALILLAGALAVSGSVAAQQGGGGGKDRGPPARVERAQPVRHDRGDDQRALSDAVRRIERRTGGQVLSAERVPFDGRDVNRVKVVDSSGRVRVYMDDPHASNAPGRTRQARGDGRRTRDDDD